MQMEQAACMFNYFCVIKYDDGEKRINEQSFVNVQNNLFNLLQIE